MRDHFESIIRATGFILIVRGIWFLISCLMIALSHSMRVPSTINDVVTPIVFTIIYPIFVLCTKTTKEGSQTQLYLSYLDYAELASGRYYADCKFEKISKTAQNNYLGREFMNYTINKICEVLPQYEKDFKQYISQ